MRRTIRLAGPAIAGLGATLLAGCTVDTHKNGDSKNIKFETPFGGMQVKTNQPDVAQEIGLPAYPGAQPAKKESGNDDNDSASVDMSFGDFHLRVKKASFRTEDAPAKVEAFYRDGLKRFGDVIACRDGPPVGMPARTPEGLTCDSDHSSDGSSEEHSGSKKLELKAGSKGRQHLVVIDPEGNGTKFGLVELDLPGKFFSNPDDDEKQ
jgi:hypothetical protein